MTLDALLQQAAQIIDDSSALLITAGAGMGVDSGLPDFRGKQGFWKAYPIARELGLDFTDLANPHHFLTNPQLAWAFYGHRLNLYRATRPHAGFAQLRQLVQSKSGGWFVYTSNVDGQFQRAGFDPQRIVECHGSIHRLQCLEPCNEHIWSAESSHVEIDEDSFRATGKLPLCPRCGGMARPNILMFGDFGWNEEVTLHQQRRFEAWWKNSVASKARIAIVELGAGTSIPTIRRLSQQLTEYENARLIRINPREYAVPHGHIGLPLGAREGIDLLLERSGDRLD
jgi:NAD-dependent SIR2 family protein deacetylase